MKKLKWTKIRFNKWSNKYDNSILQYMLFHNTHDEIIKAIKPHINIEKKVLDVACGTGQFAEKLRSSYLSYLLNVYGIDSSEGMIKEARKRSQCIDWRVGIVEKLPYKDKTFDIITSSHAFHHFQHQVIAISEMARVLKPGGILVIADGNKESFWGNILYAFVEIYEKIVHHVSEQEIRSLFLTNNLRYLHYKRFNLLIPTLLIRGEKWKHEK